MELDEMITNEDEKTLSDDNYNILCPRSPDILIYKCNLESCYFFNKKFKFNCVEIHARTVLKKNINSKILNVHLSNYYLHKIAVFIMRIQIMNNSFSFCKCGNIYPCDCEITNSYEERMEYNTKFRELCKKSKDNNKIDLETIRYYILDHMTYPIGYYVLAFDKHFGISEKEKCLNLGLTKALHEKIRGLYENT